MSEKFRIYLNDSKTGQCLLEINSHAIPQVKTEIRIGEKNYIVDKVVFILNQDESGFWSDYFSYHVLVSDLAAHNTGLL